MSAHIVRKITFFLEEGDQVFEIPYEPVEGSELISIEGDKAFVGFLSPGPDPLNPRKEFDHLGQIACWHRCYDLGDETIVGDPAVWLRELSGLEDEDATMEEVWEALNSKYMILNVSLLDHSGLHIWVSQGYGARAWDSGPVGWIYCSLERAQKEWSLPNTATWDTEVKWGVAKGIISLREATERILEAEVEEYDKYLQGDVYGVVYVEYVREGEEWRAVEEDACWGFFGWKYAKEELREGFQERRHISE